MKSISGRVVMVMGGASPIGRAVVDRLLEGESRVAVSDLSDDALREAYPPGGSVRIDAIDATELDAVAEWVSETERSWGAVDALVNVAGGWSIVDFWESSPEHWRRMLEVNLLTAMTTCRAVLPGMLERGSGSIVNFASTAGEYGSIRPSAAYAAAKAGVIGFTKSLAREVSPRGVRVNAISPGPIDTPMLNASTEAAQDEVRGRTLLGRAGMPSEIADGVAYLTGDESSYVTGHVLRVNGGSLL